MAKQIKYEIHPREYTIIGISAVMQEFFSKDFRNYYGTNLKEMVSLIKDGQYFHIQIEGDRERLDKSFLKLVNAGRYNYKKEYNDFLKLVNAYEKLTFNKKISLNIILEFYSYYRKLIKYAYAAFDTPDFVDFLKPERRKEFMKYITKIRLRAEKIYKDGEEKFIPKYSKWLVRNHLNKYTVEELQYVFWKEMENYVLLGKKLPSPKILCERKKIFYIRQYPFEKFELKQDKTAEKEIAKQQFFKEEKYDDIKELKGQIAYGGKVEGKVKLVFSRKDMTKFKKNEILVSVMTEPSYLSIMKKAKAFITDEGGVLCHAAIVARELKRPCIIGTKIATKILKDGDLVEVDANKGTVKII
ncbi:MAG: PEP-utilizing enzyme [bacterium]